MKRSWRGRVSLVVVGSLLVGCGGKPSGLALPEPEKPPGAIRPSGEITDLATARSRFTTRLLKEGPAPDEYEKLDLADGVQLVTYQSGNLKLKGLLSPGQKGVRRPAVVYLHGGWALDSEDWETAEPFHEAGFVLFTPMLRAENGNPGVYESFYGEVDDVIAAGRFVAALPGVDPENVFLAGHSVGAVLTVLAAMMPSPYKAAAAMSGDLDFKNWRRFSDLGIIVFDPRNDEEVRLRNPMEFISSLRCPLILYAEPRRYPGNQRFARRAQQLGKSCEVVSVPGDHTSMLEPSVKQAITWFQQQMKR
jgi:dipeptidyl aminopeptidase/acylaminoacyl peptidase